MDDTSKTIENVSERGISKDSTENIEMARDNDENTGPHETEKGGNTGPHETEKGGYPGATNANISHEEENVEGCTDVQLDLNGSIEDDCKDMHSDGRAPDDPCLAVGHNLVIEESDEEQEALNIGNTRQKQPTQLDNII
uniref:Uncharacterized protein n=2 Tax=Timema TaxID=61471 RepID=A0A7R8ZDK0_TIMDO|nr:unnamed protein product [Timema douglasi]